MIARILDRLIARIHSIGPWFDKQNNFLLF